MLFTEEQWLKEGLDMDYPCVYEYEIVQDSQQADSWQDQQYYDQPVQHDNPFNLRYDPHSGALVQHQQPMATPMQHMQQHCFITPSSAEDCPDVHADSPPPTLQQMQQQQPTPTGRPPAQQPLPADDSDENRLPTDENPPKTGQKRKISEENEEVAKRPFNPDDGGSTVFCRVVGRLSTVGGQRTYSVTVAEMERRMNAPECITTTLLGPFLKKGKVKDCGKALKELIAKRQMTGPNADKKALNLPRTHPICTLTSLVEEEAAQLAADHREILNTNFPSTYIARLIVMQQPVQHLAPMSCEALAAMPMIQQLAHLFAEWSAPPVSPALADFDILTHGLGMAEARTVSSLVLCFLAVLDAECRAQMIRSTAPGPPQYPELPLPDRATLYERAKEMAKDAKDHFATVDGRLTLQSRKYAVQLPEIARRLRAPESLNLSILGSILRRGKSANNGLVLREDLRAAGIPVDQGRRKSSKLTSFTALLEEEALILVRDLQAAISSTFPFKALAKELNDRAAATTFATIGFRTQALAAASRQLAHLSCMLASLRLPLSQRIPSALHDYSHIMINYSGLTHGYGPEMCIVWLETMRKVLDHARETLPLQ